MGSMTQVSFRRWSLILVLVAVGAAAGSSAAEPGRRAPGGRVGPEVARAESLRAVQDCAQLRAYFTAVAVETLVRYRYGWWRFQPWMDAGGGDPSASAPSDYTTTNTQEQGVDELDIVKTDGSFLYVAQDDRLNVVRSWPPTESARVASLALDASANGLFLLGDRALVIATAWGGGGGDPRWGSIARLELVDVSQREAPRVLRTVDVEGQVVGARMIDGQVYAVVSSYLPFPQAIWDLAWREDLGLPVVDWDATEEEREAAAEIARAILRPLVEAIVADLDLAEMVPLVRDRSAANPDPPAMPLLGCEELYLPAATAQYAFLSVLHLDLNQPDGGALDATSLLAEGWTVYASSRNLYVAQSSWWWWWGWGELDKTTQIHKFELGGDRSPVRYVASGEVPGWLLNQFSMGEQEGYLRVATTSFDWWWGTDAGEDTLGSAVTVLEDNRLGQLLPVGQLDGIAPGERIYATRFLGDTGFLVTFRQVDPLFTLDLANPRDPRLVGQLEVTGYSAYLHPVGEDFLLAVGMEADEEGRVIGLAVSLFDVSDLANPRLAHRYTVESSPDAWSWSEALWDHHAFTFHRGVLSIPAYIYENGQEFSGLIVLSVDPAQGIAELGRVDHSDLPGTDVWPQMRRSVFIEDYLYSLSSRGLKVNELFDPQVAVATVPFFPPAP
jgi:uncharacterized secreted protein with C-terminal beta-propeller domain